MDDHGKVRNLVALRRAREEKADGQDAQSAAAMLIAWIREQDTATLEEWAHSPVATLRALVNRGARRMLKNFEPSEVAALTSTLQASALEVLAERWWKEPPKP